MVIHHTHHMNSEVASQGTILVDTGNEDLCAAIPSASYIAVPAPGDDWYVVTPNKITIFISEDGEFWVFLWYIWPWLTAMWVW